MPYPYSPHPHPTYLMPRLSEGVLIHPFHSGLNSDSMTSSVIGFYIMTSPISQPNLHYHILIHSTYNTSIYHTEYSRIGNIFHTSSKCQCYVNIVHKYSKLVFINSINRYYRAYVRRKQYQYFYLVHRSR